MPHAVSRRQYRMMMAILRGKADPAKAGGRGLPPKSVAGKYHGTPDPDSLPEQSGENRGGNWDETHHAKDKERVYSKRGERKAAKKDKKEKARSKKDLHKAFEEYYDGKGQAAAAIVMDDMNRVLLGNHSHGGLAFAGGHMDSGDMGEHAVTALRELKEETGLVGHNPNKVWSGKEDGNKCVVYLVESYTGKLKSSDELKNLKWVEPHEIKWEKIRPCCVRPLKALIENKLGKSLKGMMALESLEKKTADKKDEAVFEITHGEALKLVGNGLFRKIKQEVKDMDDEGFKDFHLDTHTVSIRKHMDDTYSGRVTDGHKVIYQFTNKSLPQTTAALMSVFEWYSPEDESVFEELDEGKLSDDAIEGGLSSLVDNYKRHNISNIYQEMEGIRGEIRGGMAVDLQQVEARIMKLFDRLEEVIHTLSEKHNKLSQDAGKEMDELEGKLRELQNKIDEMGKRPEKVEAFSANPVNPKTVHDENFFYLPRPQVEISPNGKILITFSSEWAEMEKENFLKDMRAKVVKKSKT